MFGDLNSPASIIDCVCIRTTINHITASPGNDDIIAIPAFDSIIASPADQQIIPALAIEGIIAIIAGQRIIMGRTLQIFDACQHIAFRIALQTRIAEAVIMQSLFLSICQGKLISRLASFRHKRVCIRATCPGGDQPCCHIQLMGNNIIGLFSTAQASPFCLGHGKQEAVC